MGSKVAGKIRRSNNLSHSRSDVLLHQLQESLKFSEWAGIHPFKWDFETRQIVHIPTNSGKYRWFVLNTVAMLMYLAYIGARFLWKIHLEEIDLAGFINNALVLGYYGMLLLSQMLNWQNQEDFHSLTNAYFCWFRSSERVLWTLENSAPMLKVAEILGWAIRYLFPLYGMAALHGAIFPQSIDSLHPVFSKTLEVFFCLRSCWFQSFACYGLAAAAHAWIGFNIGALLWFFATAGVSELFFLVAVLKQLRSKRHLLSGFLEVQNVLTIYQRLQILLVGSQVAFDIALWLPVLCSMIVAIFGAYVLITVGGIMSFVAVVVGGGVLMFMLTTFVFFAEIVLESTRLKADLRTWNTMDSKYTPKVLRAMRNARVTVAGLFTINKVLVLVLLKVVVDSLANTLLLSRTS